MANLPQSFYDDLANASLPTVTAPAGTYTLAKQVKIQRSDVTVDMRGCTLNFDPAVAAAFDGSDTPFTAFSTRTSHVWKVNDVQGGAARTISRLGGVITETTTQLVMHPSEIVTDLAPGERVIIWAGVNRTDPVEAYCYLTAIVESVNLESGVITFTKPLGRNVTNYGSLAALTAVVTPSQQFKVGVWGSYPDENGDHVPDYSNPSKGYGIDHGMERFVGGMVANVRIIGPTVNLSTVTISTAPNLLWFFSAVAVDGFTIEDAVIANPVGSIVHTFRSFNVLLDGMTVTGVGIAKISAVSLSEAIVFSAWGGDYLVAKDMVISSTNTILSNMEVSPGHIFVRGLTANVTFNSLRTYPSSPTFFNYSSALDPPMLANCELNCVTTGGSAHAWQTFEANDYRNVLIFGGASLSASLDFGNLRFPQFNACRVKIGGVTYGPQEHVTGTQVVAWAASRTVSIPGIVLPTARFRLTVLGDCRALTDSFGVNYSNSPAINVWYTLNAPAWHTIGTGTTNLANYVTKYVRFWFNDTAQDLACTVEWDYQYLPLARKKKWHIT